MSVVSPYDKLVLEEREIKGREEMPLSWTKPDLLGVEKPIFPVPVIVELAVEANETANKIGIILIIVESLQEFHHGFLLVAVKSRL